MACECRQAKALSTTPGAIRARRRRARERAGVMLVTLEFTEGFVEKLVEAGFLRPEFADDQKSVERAAQAYISSAQPVKLKA